MSQAAKIKLDRLTGYLASDPDNVPLLIEAIEAAFDASSMVAVDDLVNRLKTLRPDSYEARYFSGLWAMMDQDFGEAAAILDPLVTEGAPPNARFNLAWSRAMLGEKSEALRLLDSETTAQFPAAAMLRVQLLHEAGEFQAAMAFGRTALDRFPAEPGLNAALATLALDLEDTDLARHCAARGGEHPEALAAAGIVDLQDGDPAAARQRFDRSIALRQHNPRAWIGRGLSRLIDRDHVEAARDLDCGAQQFVDHLGSWLAAGWAHYLAGDLAAAQQRFERAHALDPTFAESHGALAVIDAAKGDEASARLRMITALRLDKACFAAALARVMLEAETAETARALVEQAFVRPFNATGMTVARYLAGLTRPTVH